jgi:hypothetical protein
MSTLFITFEDKHKLSCSMQHKNSDTEKPNEEDEFKTIELVDGLWSRQMPTTLMAENFSVLKGGFTISKQAKA